MKLKQKILTLVLSLCVVAACLPVVASAETAPQGLWTDYAASAFDGGSGTKADPYQIATAEQLALLAKEMKKMGYPLARRTVAKYREQLGLPVARLRRC